MSKPKHLTLTWDGHIETTACGLVSYEGGHSLSIDNKPQLGTRKLRDVKCQTCKGTTAYKQLRRYGRRLSIWEASAAKAGLLPERRQA